MNRLTRRIGWALVMWIAAGLKLIDTYRKLHPARQPEEATSGGFSGRRAGSRIDGILVSPEFTPVEATIDRFNKDGRYPSDHFPVTATLR